MASPALRFVHPEAALGWPATPRRSTQHPPLSGYRRWRPRTNGASTKDFLADHAQNTDVNLHATDQAARQTKRNRSALVRDALREHLRRLEARAREERDRQGYATGPQTTDETDVCEAEAVWPAQ